MDLNNAGAKLRGDSGAEVIVIRPTSDGDLAMRPGGPVLLGKRYRCSGCGSEVLATKSGDDEVICHGLTMAPAEARQLPSSD